MLFLLIKFGVPDQMKLKITDLRSLRNLSSGFSNTESKTTSCEIPNDLIIVILPIWLRSLFDQILKIFSNFSSFGTQLSSEISCKLLLKALPISERYLLYI